MEEMVWCNGMVEKGRDELKKYIGSYLAKGLLVVLVGFLFIVLLTTSWNDEYVRTAQLISLVICYYLPFLYLFMYELCLELYNYAELGRLLYI